MQWSLVANKLFICGFHFFLVSFCVFEAFITIVNYRYFVKKVFSWSDEVFLAEC